MNARELITRDPALLVGQAREVLDFMIKCEQPMGLPMDEGAVAARYGLLRFLDLVFDSINARLKVDFRNATVDDLEAVEECGVDILHAIGLTGAIIGDNSGFTVGESVDSPGLEAIRTLLFLAKDQVDDAAGRLIAGRATTSAILSTDALADINGHIAEIGALVDQMLECNCPGYQDPRIVNLLDFAIKGCAEAKTVSEFDDAWHRITDAESLLHAAIALSGYEKSASLGVERGLRNLLESSQTLSAKFDCKGVHYQAQQRAATPNSPVARQEEAVAA